MFLYGATMFLSAFLLFLVQPLIGKFILPWFGGTPAVWTTCMLFFQALLLVGYGYAHALARRFTLRRQSEIHVAILFITVLFVLVLSIFPPQSWKPADDQSPVLRILGLLLVSIGAPYLVLSATSPLLQAWFSRTRQGASPYRLYALSNLGSLLAIAGYPLVIEPSIRLSRQGSLFSWMYVLFALLCAAVSLKIMNRRGASGVDGPTADGDPAIEIAPGPVRYILWLSLTVCSSVMLLATTSQLCQDLAVVPLLWILPLSIYLLSFILCFQYERLYWRPVFVTGLAGALVWTCFVLNGGVVVALKWQILSYSLTLFASCMICHGELVRLKPGARHLTAFYLMIAAGGSLGALLVTAGAPHLFRGYWEYQLGLLATALLMLVVMFRDRRGLLFQGRAAWIWALWVSICGVWILLIAWFADDIWRSFEFRIGLGMLLVVSVIAFFYDRKGRLCLQRPLRVWMIWTLLSGSWLVLALVLRFQVIVSMGDIVEARRNFFGVLKVLDLYNSFPGQHSLSLMHGRIEHGFQFQDEEKRHWPVSYYGMESGVGVAISSHPRRLENGTMNIGVIGLGTGTLATYGQPGDTIDFYEINPAVVQLSDKYFTYRKDSKARIEVILGDARVSLDRERQRGASRKFDVLVVDAFSSDAIPVHLLTRECFQTYRYHLKEDGIVAVHITNRYFDLKPIVRNLISRTAESSSMQALWIENMGNTSLGTDHTSWVLLTSNRKFLADPDVLRRVTPWSEALSPEKIWTDDYSDLIGLLHERKTGF